MSLRSIDEAMQRLACSSTPERKSLIYVHLVFLHQFYLCQLPRSEAFKRMATQ